MTDDAHTSLKPLPYYGWETRPASIPVDIDEARTALFLAKGDIAEAARLLRVSRGWMKRYVRERTRLQFFIRDECGGSLSKDVVTAPKGNNAAGGRD